MSFVNLRTAILNKLTTLVGTGKPLVFVDDKLHLDLTGFPSAVFEPSGHENEYYTSTDNKRIYKFDIYILQEMEQGGRDNAVGVLAGAVDAVVAAFDADFTLGGTCDLMRALPSEWGVFQGTNGMIMYARLVLSCQSEVQVV